MSSLPAALKAELTRLQRELEADPRFKRMRKIESLLADYEPPFSIKPQPAATGDATKWAKVKQAIDDILRERVIVSRRDILDHLIAKGLMGTESKPMKRLGIYLNKGRDTWTSDGAGNWRLKGPLPPAPKPRVPPLPSSGG